MNTDKLIKELELLADSCESNYALEVNGYSQGVNDAIDLVKKLTIPVVVGRSEQLPIARCGCKEPDPTEIKVCIECDGYVE